MIYSELERKYEEGKSYRLRVSAAVLAADETAGDEPDGYGETYARISPVHN